MDALVDLQKLRVITPHNIGAFIQHLSQLNKLRYLDIGASFHSLLNNNPTPLVFVDFEPLTNLENLKLHLNRVVPSSLPITLRELSLGDRYRWGNDRSQYVFDLGLLCALKQLTHLTLLHMSLTGGISRLDRLLNLNLQNISPDSQIDSMWSLFNNIPNVETLMLTDVPFGILDLDIAQKLTSTVSVCHFDKLVNIQLIAVPINCHFNDLPNIQSLDLSNIPNFDESIIITACQNKTLTKLHYDRTPLMPDFFDQLCLAPNKLKSLNLNNMNMIFTGKNRKSLKCVAMLSQIKTLEELIIDSTPISLMGFIRLTQLPILHTLRVYIIHNKGYMYKYNGEKFEKLCCLHVRMDSISDAHATMILSMVNVETLIILNLLNLNIRRTLTQSIDDTLLKSASMMKNLRTYIGPNKISIEGAQYLPSLQNLENLNFRFLFAPTAAFFESLIHFKNLSFAILNFEYIQVDPQKQNDEIDKIQIVIEKHFQYLGFVHQINDRDIKRRHDRWSGHRERQQSIVCPNCNF